MLTQWTADDMEVRGVGDSTYAQLLSGWSWTPDGNPHRDFSGHNGWSRWMQPRRPTRLDAALSWDHGRAELPREWKPGVAMDMTKFRKKAMTIGPPIAPRRSFSFHSTPVNKLWSNRFGDLTALRVPAEAIQGPETVLERPCGSGLDLPISGLMVGQSGRGREGRCR